MYFLTNLFIFSTKSFFPWEVKTVSFLCGLLGFFKISYYFHYFCSNLLKTNYHV